MRELIFSDTGIALADPYTAGGGVLMGTLRTEKETENAMHPETGLQKSPIVAPKLPAVKKQEEQK